MEVFHDYAYYYDLFYKDKDYSAEAATVDTLIKRYQNKTTNKKILSIGCGTGKHDRELNKMGYSVHGIDLSSEMIDIAKRGAEDNSELSYEVQDARNFVVKGKYDIIISLFHVMSYQNSNEDLEAAFSSVEKALTDDGIFIFDAWYGPGVLSERPAVRVKRVEDDKNLFVRIAEPIMHPNDNIVDVCYDVSVVNKNTSETRKINEVHNMRYYFRPEIEYMLSKCGLELVSCVDCNSLEEPDFNSWTAYFIARRKVWNLYR